MIREAKKTLNETNENKLNSKHWLQETGGQHLNLSYHQLTHRQSLHLKTMDRLTLTIWTKQIFKIIIAENKLS